MSQRSSGYERKANDAYETPSWVTQALVPYIPVLSSAIWEPACGSGKMADVLFNAGWPVIRSDITTGCDFLREQQRDDVGAIITNPPYSDAEDFIKHALALMEPVRGFVAMLLRADYDSAHTRRKLFKFPFAKKLVLTKRIRWIEGSTGSPSFNHSWFVWDFKHKGAPTLAYGPDGDEV